MATIQIVLEAINAATRNIDEVAGRLEVLDHVQEQAAESARALTAAELGAAQAAVDAVSAYEELRQKTADLSREAEAAGVWCRELADRELDAANAAIRASAAFGEQDVQLLDVTRDAMLAAGGIRAMSAAELDAASNATRTALAIKFLDEAEIGAINSTLAWTTALHAEAEAEKAAAAGAVVNAAATKAAGASTAASTAAVNGARFAWGFWGAAIRAVNQPLQLWGGLLDGLLPKMLTQVGGLHVLADAVIEIAAVWGPAAIAAGAWGLAASDAVQEVQRHLAALHTVSDAFDQSIKPMTGNLEKMHDAVRPQVYQIFGEALSVMTKKGGELNTVIQQTGQVFTQLAARAALAINSANMNEFLKNSVTDVRLLGQSFGNLFGIFGNLIRMNQGWATILLQTGTAILGLIEHVTAVLIPLGQFLVFWHGFVLWVGLAVTAAVKFGAVIIGWGAALAGAVTDFIGLISAMRDFIAAYGLIEALSLVNPMVWVGIAAGALVGLVLLLHNAKNATQQWGDSLLATAQNAQTLSAGSAALFSGQTQVTLRLAQAQNQLAASGVTAAQAARVVADGVQRGNPAVLEQIRHYQDLKNVQSQLTAAQDTYSTRLDRLAKTYGGTANAEGLLITAGITMKQMLDKSGAAWAMIQQQVEAAYRGYGAMTNQTGMLGNAMQVLDKQQTDQYKAMQKLNQGWDTQIAAMTGAMSAFDTVAQGFQTLSSGSAKFSTSLGRLKVTGIDFVKSGIDSLSKSGIALNQAFTQQVGQINSMADSWRSAGLAQNIFKSGLAASIAPLEKYAAGSQEATAQLVGLAQEAGYQGPISLNALNKYLGITGGMLKHTGADLKTMQAAAQQATIQEALLSSAMQAQGSYIAGQLIGDINSAILKYNGVAQAAAAYGRAVAESGRQSDAAHNARSVLIADLINAGKAAGDGTQQIAAMITKITGIPKDVAIQIVMRGTGDFTITGAAVKASQGPGGSGNAAGGLARGGMVYAKGVVANKDAIPIMAKLGEVVVPTEMVNAGAVDHLRGRLPGFNRGGLVLAGNTSVLTGDYAVSAYSQFKSAGISRMEAAMMNAARASGARFAGGGQVGGNGTSGPVAGQAPYGGVFVQAAVIQGFTGGLEQLHTPLVLLGQAIHAQTQATQAQTAAATASSAATTKAATTAKTAKPPTQVQKDRAKIAADKANAAMLAAHIKTVQQAIKDTPAKDKAARANETKVLHELQAALAKQNRGTKADEAKLTRDIIKTNRELVAAMHKQIAAITKLLASGSSATSKSGLWAKLAADEHTLAGAQAALAHVLSGRSGGSARGKITATVDKGSLAALQAGEVRAFNTAVAALRASIAKGGPGSKLAASDLATLLRRQAAEVAQYQKASADRTAANMSHLLALIHEELRTSADKGLNRAAPGQMARLVTALNKLDAAIGRAGFTTRRGSSGGGPAGSGSYTSGTGTSRKSEQELAQLLTVARAELAELKQVCVLLGAIKKEAEPAAQAKAIGPAVAQALNSTAGRAAAAKTTRRG